MIINHDGLMCDLIECKDCGRIPLITIDEPFKNKTKFSCESDECKNITIHDHTENAFTNICCIWNKINESHSPIKIFNMFNHKYFVYDDEIILDLD